jgi:hypothetical protein
VRTVAFTPTFTIDAVLDALEAGRTVLTDGPMLAFGIDKTGDGTIDQLADGQIGSLQKVGETSSLDLLFKWQSTAEFGEVGRVVLVRGTKATGSKPATYELLTDPEGLGSCKDAARLAGTCKVTLGRTGALALPPAGTTYYYRAMALSGAGKFRCLTNPIWIQGTTDPGPTDAGPADSGAPGADSSVEADAGAVEDAGGNEVDARADEDATVGSTTSALETSCSCAVPGARRAPSQGLAALGLAALALSARRARARRR